MSLSDSIDLPRPFGPYTLMRRLAVGGMAEVYVAKARGIGGFEKLVALKVIHPRYSEDDHFVTMLVDEAKLSVLLNHVNIAQTFDLGCIDETFFIVMELVEGADAYTLLRRANQRPASLPLDICAYIVSEMCMGLSYAHRKCDVTGMPLRIVHRDVSPQNVLISFAGEVKIVDFGIAKAALRSGNTEVGVIKGKYYYMSPEQAWGDEVDHRSDIFSAGIVLHELLTGEMLYQEENLPKLLDRVRKAEILPPSRKRQDVPPELDEILMRAVARQPEDRWATAHDLAQALSQFVYRYLPSFTPSRLAAMMGQLFEVEVTETLGGVSPPSNEKVLSSIHGPFSGALTAPTVDGLGPMKPDEFRPDVTKSVIFEPSDEFKDEPTMAVVQRKRLSSHPPQWDEVTTKGTAAASGGPFVGEEFWEDPTMVDVGGVMMARMRQVLERQIAQRNRQQSSQDRLVPLDRPQFAESDTLDRDEGPTRRKGSLPASHGASSTAHPPAVRHRSSVDESPDPRAAPSVPPPPPVVPRRSAPSVPPRPSAAASGWGGQGRTDVSVPQDSAAVPDLSGWQEQSSEVRPAVAPRPELAPAPLPSSLDTDRLRAVEVAPPRRRWLGVLLIVTVAMVIGATFLYRKHAVVRPVASRVEITSVPPGAAVTFDGQALPGVTPVVLARPMEPQRAYPVRLELEGYERHDGVLHGRQGNHRHLVVLVPQRLDVEVRTLPPGQRIWVDGMSRGRAPVTLKGVTVGQELHLRARTEGREVRQTVVVARDSSPIVLRP